MKRQKAYRFWRSLFGIKDNLVAESFPEYKSQMRICFENWELAKLYEKLNVIEMKLDKIQKRLELDNEN